MYDAVIITDPNGHIIEVNARAEEHFGYTADEVVDRQVATLISGLSTEIVKRIRSGLEENHRMMIDANAIRKDGSRFACEVTVSVIDLMDPDDLVFTVRNIERRRQLRERLRAKEDAFDLAGAALFACTREGRFTQINGEFLATFGLENEEEARNLAFNDLFTDAPLGEKFARALDGESSTICIASEPEEGEEAGRLEIRLGPSRAGNKVVGVVGSLMKV